MTPDEQHEHPEPGHEGYSGRDDTPTTSPSGVDADDEPRFEDTEERVPQGGEHLGEAPIGEHADEADAAEPGSDGEHPASGQMDTERFEDG